MKYLVIILLFIFQQINCFSQNKIKLEYQNDNLIQEIGIGLVQQVNVNGKIILFEDSKLKTIKSKDAKLGKDIIPLLNKVDYSILFFLCVEKNNNYYKVAISKGKYAFIKPSDKYIYYNWNDFLKNHLTSVDCKNKNSLFDNIDGKVVIYKNINSDDEIEIINLKGDWLNIKNTTINKNYWVKWKEKNKLLINLNLLM
jgi:hypothetical protein